MSNGRLDALTVRESGDKSYWTRIGVAFPNKNGPGYRVMLDAMPASTDGQFIIHLREPRENGATPGANDRGSQRQQSGGNRARDRDVGISGWDDDGAPF